MAIGLSKCWRLQTDFRIRTSAGGILSRRPRYSITFRFSCLKKVYIGSVSAASCPEEYVILIHRSRGVGQEGAKLYYT